VFHKKRSREDLCRDHHNVGQGAKKRIKSPHSLQIKKSTFTPWVEGHLSKQKKGGEKDMAVSGNKGGRGLKVDGSHSCFVDGEIVRNKMEVGVMGLSEVGLLFSGLKKRVSEREREEI